MCLKIIIVLKFLRLSLPGPEPLNSQALVLKTMLNHNEYFYSFTKSVRFFNTLSFFCPEVRRETINQCHAFRRPAKFSLRNYFIYLKDSPVPVLIISS